MQGYVVRKGNQHYAVIYEGRRRGGLILTGWMPDGRAYGL